ncbi:hypothetical protein CCMA1212_009752 [Trichoderma ghanense]|uniref:Uncharacterized protein n=1 Tax=Trichoderma ghanense TaxID=65468 RepID=A0ABY2GRJ1_9HYPO
MDSFSIARSRPPVDPTRSVDRRWLGDGSTLAEENRKAIQTSRCNVQHKDGGRGPGWSVWLTARPNQAAAPWGFSGLLQLASSQTSGSQELGVDRKKGAHRVC